MGKFNEKEWTFLNANSPADLYADYGQDGSVKVREYDRCRNGHILVSKFFADSYDMEAEVEVAFADDRAAVGLYYGNGDYFHFLQAVISNKKISLEIPSGVPLADTFRYEGAKRTIELAAVEYGEGFPAALRLKKKDRICTVFVNGREYLHCELPDCKEWNARWVRIMLGAVNNDSRPVVEAGFQEYQISEKAEFAPCAGILTDENRQVCRDYSIHLCLSGDYWTRTDENGSFSFENLPEGRYDAVAGKAGGRFLHLKIENIGTKLNIIHQKAERIPEKKLYEEVTSDSRKISLNGIWNFEWDKAETGEAEKWFLAGAHKFSKVIQVPFSFHSLEAFGESFLADDYSHREAASWYVNLKESGKTVWYERSVKIPESGEWELVAGAVSGFGKVWINGKCVGCTVDSYEKFRFSAGKRKMGEELSVVIKVEYPPDHKESCRGKQDFWFHASPGIWQNIWLEKTQPVKAEDIQIQYTMNGDETSLLGTVFWKIQGKGKAVLESHCCSDGTISCRIPEYIQGDCKLTVWYYAEQTETVWMKTKNQHLCMRELDAAGRNGYFDEAQFYIRLKKEREILFGGFQHDFSVIRMEVEQIERPASVETIFRRKYSEEYPKEYQTEYPEEYSEEQAFISDEGKLISEFHFDKQKVKKWTPECPALYEIEVTAGIQSGEMLRFSRQAGFRNVDTGNYIRLNGEELYIRGVLDQGYNPWGIYTYPMDEGGCGSMEYDLEKAKEFGYNLIRMHIKDTEPLWYQMCDEKGMLVWDEHPVNFYAKWENPRWRSMYRRRLKDMIRKQNYHPSVIIYSTFNESWGITGGHEMSPWNETGAQKWQKETAEYYKKKSGNVLVVDNSGYAKTEVTDLLDYHMYPDEFEDARSFFAKMEKENYEGSCFNCYNRGNRRLMQDDDRRELLQRNCRMNLKEMDYEGEAVQHGQPVLISEFVHTGRIEQMIRIYDKVAGYIRMNLASQENEDTSPLTVTRKERDFGYRHFDFTHAGYRYVNAEHLVWADVPVLSKRYAGETFLIPVYTRIWKKEVQNPELWIYESKTDQDGTEQIPELVEKKQIQVSGKESVFVGEYRYRVPENVRAAQLFFVIKEAEAVLAETDIRMEVFEKHELPISRKFSEPDEVFSECMYGSLCEQEDRDGFYMAGAGSVKWRIPVKTEKLEQDLKEKLERNIPVDKVQERMSGIVGTDKKSKWILRMELSSCECICGTRITDTQKYRGMISIELNENRIVSVELEDCPWDERAVFSNSACGTETAVPYKKWGKYGYGQQIDIVLSEEEKQSIQENGYITCRIQSDESGVILYGRRMGRYGAEPAIIRKE